MAKLTTKAKVAAKAAKVSAAKPTLKESTTAKKPSVTKTATATDTALSPRSVVKDSVKKPRAMATAAVTAATNGATQKAPPASRTTSAKAPSGTVRTSAAVSKSRVSSRSKKNDDDDLEEDDFGNETETETETETTMLRRDEEPEEEETTEDIEEVMIPKLNGSRASAEEQELERLTRLAMQDMESLLDEPATVPAALPSRTVSREANRASREATRLRKADAATGRVIPPRIIEPKLDDEPAEEEMMDEAPVRESFAPVPIATRPQRVSVSYSDEDLAMFREHITAERKKALEEFVILRENLEDLTNSEMADENASYSMHMAEQGTDAQEKEKLYAHVQRVSDYIKRLEEALQRINDKVYGICKMCGILIAKERLLAVPITTQSASYKLRRRCPEDGIDRIVKR
jgi:DnaK suppressor protein